MGGEDLVILLDFRAQQQVDILGSQKKVKVGYRDMEEMVVLVVVRQAAIGKGKKILNGIMLEMAEAMVETV